MTNIAIENGYRHSGITHCSHGEFLSIAVLVITRLGKHHDVNHGYSKLTRDSTGDLAHQLGPELIQSGEVND